MHKMSFKITPVKEKDMKQSYRITPAQEDYESILSENNFQSRPLTEEELWVMGLVGWKTGMLWRFKMRDKDGKTIVKMGYP